MSTFHNHEPHTDHLSHSHDYDHSHDEGQSFGVHSWLRPLIAFGLLILGIICEIVFKLPAQYLLFIFLAPYLIVGLPVLKAALKSITKGRWFDENTLMSIATIAAFGIGAFSEAVAVMLFYAIGEAFQDWAISKSKSSIKSLLDIRPKEATVIRDNIPVIVNPEDIKVGEIIEIRSGEKVPLDGVLLSDTSNFDTVALTGESKPKVLRQTENVLAGMVNLGGVIRIEVNKKFEDSSFAKILDLVQNASKSKAKTQLFITKFASIYTPIVVGLAIAIVVLPLIFVQPYIFQDWVYRAIIFLIISCPCGLVISIPLGYFGGIGASARNGILLKGSNYLDTLTEIDTVVFDKTGTLTEGIFEVRENTLTDEQLSILASLESKSTHPIAKAISEYASFKSIKLVEVNNVFEVAGHGLTASLDGQIIIAGNDAILHKYNIEHPDILHDIVETVVFLCIDNKYIGSITIADKIKSDAQDAITNLKIQGIKNLIMLSGDKDVITQKVAEELGLTMAFGDLLPEDKATKVQELKTQGYKIAFVGDGINDAPVIALADVGIAMGGMGSDVAIETANVVLQTDQPSKLPIAIKIAKFTKSIVWQNIALALGVKVIVMILGASGNANLWEAVFADVGVALLAILNANRVLNKKY